MDPLTTLLTTTTTATATYLAVRGRAQRARRQALLERFEGHEVDLPLETSHLSPQLGALVIGARTVRLLLQTPLHRYEEVLVHETPWRRRERLEQYDLALGTARRALWEWLLGLSQLQTGDIETLRRLRLDPRPLRSLMWKPGVFDRTDDVFETGLFPVPPDLQQVSEDLCAAMEHLRSFEIALLSHKSTPYR